MVYAVYQIFYMGHEMPEGWWRAWRYVGQLEQGFGQLGRSRFKTVSLIDRAYKNVIPEMEYASMTAYKEGRILVRGQQRPAHLKGAKHQIRSYPQQWLCFPQDGRYQNNSKVRPSAEALELV